MRSKTESPCLHRAVVEIQGIPLCEACAREQEAYFAIGELTQETQGLRSGALGKTLGETLGGMRRQRVDGLRVARRLGLSRVEGTERLAFTESQAELAGNSEDRRPNKDGAHD